MPTPLLLSNYLWQESIKKSRIKDSVPSLSKERIHCNNFTTTIPCSQLLPWGDNIINSIKWNNSNLQLFNKALWVDSWYRVLCILSFCINLHNSIQVVVLISWFSKVPNNQSKIMSHEKWWCLMLSKRLNNSWSQILLWARRNQWRKRGKTHCLLKMESHTPSQVEIHQNNH